MGISKAKNVGRAGGLARARALSPRRRSIIARRAAKVRWSKAKADPRVVLRDKGVIGAICRRRGIKSLYAFGSVLRSDFGPQSDVDLMYTGDLGSLDYFNARADFKRAFGRDIDLASKTSVELHRDRIRQRHVLATAELIHEEE